MTRPAPLDDAAVERLVADHPRWRRDGVHLRADLEFANFSEAFAFMTRVALIAEKLNHHPEWSNVWNKVQIAISTHDTGGLSQLDAEFVTAVDKL